MCYFVLTNNVQVLEECGSTHEVCFVDGSLNDVLLRARDLINEGSVLLVHPLYGSVKPNETPYRSLLISKPACTSDVAAADPESVRLIGNAITTCRKFIDKKKITDPKLLQECQVVDLSLLKREDELADQ